MKNKDLKVATECLQRAYKIAVKKGLKRSINGSKFLEVWMRDDVGILIQKDYEKSVIAEFVDVLMDLENLCREIDKGTIKESTIKLFSDCINW